jgi:SAM-dependent methyltransferase
MAPEDSAQHGVDQLAECPICGTTTPNFLPHSGRTAPDWKPEPDRKCPTCHSLERHRMLWLYFQTKTNLFRDPVRMLHVAPEKCISDRLQAHQNIDYLSADLASSSAMMEMDITDIQFPSESFDVIYASHVLEHIDDDRRAMRELHRVLRTGGWAVLMVPIWGAKTREDPTVTEPRERERLFGQFDHVRMYGHDGEYERRLREAGFEVKVDPFVPGLGPEMANRYRLMKSEDIYYCAKPGRPASRHFLPRSWREFAFRMQRSLRRPK